MTDPSKGTSRILGETPPPGQVGRVRRFFLARLDHKAYLGLHLTVALAVVALGLWAFGALLDAVLDNALLVRWDMAVDAAIHARVTPAGLNIFNWITRIGSPASMAVVALVVAVILWRQHRRTALTAWIAATGGGAILDSALKLLVHRTRPAYGAGYLHGTTFSFPSGHAMGSIVAVGMLLYLLGRYWHPPHVWRIVSIVVGVILVVLIGISRIYLGVHYPSDIMGGWAAGAAWVAICVTALSLVEKPSGPGVIAPTGRRGNFLS
jgi:membrane-associated phospholipid phosphatase